MLSEMEKTNLQAALTAAEWIGQNQSLKDSPEYNQQFDRYKLNLKEWYESISPQIRSKYGMALQILEHLPKEEADRFLNMLVHKTD